MALELRTPGMKNAIVLLLPLIADESDCDGLSEGVLDRCIGAPLLFYSFVIICPQSNW